MDLSQADFLGVRYPLNEVFETVQGEAHWTGAPAVFLRLQGCPVGCGWCDTKHTWFTQEATKTTLEDILTKTADSPSWAEATIADILSIVGAFAARHVVITGGEPCIHDLTPLTRLLLRLGRTVQIETSGTHDIRCDPETWVTVSPKIGMGGGLTVRPAAIARANEIKHPVGKARDIENLLTVLPYARPDAVVWLQPLSQSKAATALCVEQATLRGWRVSIQTHKFIGIR